MKLSPLNSNWPALLGFYQNLAEELHRRGVMSLTTGGIACVFYDLAQTTKDCDIIIPIEKAPLVLETLAQIGFLGHKCHLTLKYGAPLDQRWLNGGRDVDASLLPSPAAFSGQEEGLADPGNKPEL